MTVTIIPRTKWGARYRRGFGPAPLPARNGVYLHHSVTVAPDLVWIDADRDGVEDDEEKAMRLLEQIGEDRFGGGISYTFAAMPSGRVYEGHGIDRQGAHTAGLNSTARAIVLVGDYSQRRPTEAQLNSVAGLLVMGRDRGWWPHARLAGGHRQAPGASTACPGDAAFAMIPSINHRATQPQGGFLMALDADDQQQVKVAADRILGITDQRYWKDGKQVADGTAGATPVPLLDGLDGAHLATRIGQAHEKIDKLMELVQQLVNQKGTEG